jgi:hypothetical protein
VGTHEFVDWAVYQRDQERTDKAMEKLVDRLDRLAAAIESVVKSDQRSRVVLRAEWIRLVSAFVAGAIPAVVVALISSQ